MLEKLYKIMRTDKSFGSPYFEALIAVMLLNHQQLKRQAEFFAPYGITPAQYNALRILRGQYPTPCSLNLVKERIVDKNSDVSRLIERLRKSDLVSRVTNQEDRRGVDILITEKGLSLLKELDDKVWDLWELPNLSPDEAHLLAQLIDKALM